MRTTLSEYPLAPNHELRVGGDALWVDGVGWLGQYHSYLDSMWQKGLPYFIRDYCISEGVELCVGVDALNSKIREYERTCQLQASPP